MPQAHHILPVSQFGEALAKKLHEWGVALNGADNGVWLPETGYPGYNGAVHRGKNTNEYIREVNRRLSQAFDRDSALAILDQLRNDLLNGNLLLNSAR